MGDVASRSIVDGFSVVYEHNFDEVLANKSLECYASDIWSCLSTSGEYFHNCNVTVEEFSGMKPLFRVTKEKLKAIVKNTIFSKTINQEFTLPA